jgi:hypothetical protein
MRIDLTAPITGIGFVLIIVMYFILSSILGPEFWPHHPVFRISALFALVGDGLNAVAVFSNRSRMPVRKPGADRFQGKTDLPERFVSDIEKMNMPENVSRKVVRDAQEQLDRAGPVVRFPYLCERYEIKLHRRQWICSVGDFFIFGGIFLLAVEAIQRVSSLMQTS